MSADALRPLYRALARDVSTEMSGVDDGLARQACLVGQPVQLAGGMGGLRVAMSAAQIVSGADLRPDLAMVFGKVAMLLDRVA
jgi:hypothetical protein